VEYHPPDGGPDLISDIELEKRITRIEADIEALARESGVNSDALKKLIRDRGGYPVDMELWRKMLAEGMAGEMLFWHRMQATQRKTRQQAEEDMLAVGFSKMNHAWKTMMGNVGKEDKPDGVE